MSEIKNIRINNFELKLADSDDPIASKVSWGPAKPGGANFKAHHNAERINVMDGGDSEYVEDSAVRLAAYLDVPVWRAQY